MVSFKEYIARESQARQAARPPDVRKLLHEGAGAARTIGSLAIDAASAAQSAGIDREWEVRMNSYWRVLFGY